VRDNMKDYISLNESNENITTHEKINRIEICDVAFTLADYTIIIVNDMVRISRKKDFSF